MNKSLVSRKLDVLVTTGMIKSYLCHDIEGCYDSCPYQALTITFPNDETLEVSSRGGGFMESWLVVD
jgi:ferredoxin